MSVIVGHTARVPESASYKLIVLGQVILRDFDGRLSKCELSWIIGQDATVILK